MKKIKLIKAVTAFMLFIPFRLPISVLLINIFNSFAKIGVNNIPIEVLITNIMITKGIYNLIISAWFCYSIEILSRELLGRNPIEYRVENSKTIFWWTGLCIALSVIFIGLDMWNTYSLTLIMNHK